MCVPCLFHVLRVLIKSPLSKTLVFISSIISVNNFSRGGVKVYISRRQFNKNYDRHPSLGWRKHSKKLCVSSYFTTTNSKSAPTFYHELFMLLFFTAEDRISPILQLEKWRHEALKDFFHCSHRGRQKLMAYRRGLLFKAAAQIMLSLM